METPRRKFPFLKKMQKSIVGNNILNLNQSNNLYMSQVIEKKQQPLGKNADMDSLVLKQSTLKGIGKEKGGIPAKEFPAEPLECSGAEEKS